MKLTIPKLLVGVLFFIVFSCRKENNPPNIMDQTFSVKENSTPGLICATISASDPDGDVLTYKLDEVSTDFPFEIDSKNGNLKIKLNVNLDYEQIQQYKFRVIVKDATKSSSACVSIQIIDQQEIPNVIDQSFDIKENIEGLFSFGIVKFVSKGQNEEFNFSIVEGNTSNLFFIGEKSGELFLAKGVKLNYESAKSYSLQIKVQNKSNTELYTSITIGVNVLDVNENPTISDQSFSIPENSQNNTEIGSVIATDVDAGQSLNYSIIQSTISNAVNVDAITGKLFVSDKSKFDYETNKKIILAIKVTDNGTGALSDTANVTVNILDVNENPVISTKKLTIDENSLAGKEVGKVIASSYEGTPIEYTIVEGDGKGIFTIDKNTGMISVALSGVLNYETKKSYSLTLKVNETAKLELTTTDDITIDLNDINEHPVLTDQQFTSYKSDAVGVIFGRVSASDPDNGQTLLYSIIAGNSEGYFSIDSSTGNISLTKPVMMNGNKEINFVLVIQVTDNGLNSLSAEANAMVTVLQTTIPQNGLIAYYPLNGNANDESLNRFDGDIVGPLSTSDRKETANSAFSFNGLNDYIKLSTLVGNGIRSMSLWFRLDNNFDGSGNANTLISREGDFNNNSEFALALVPSASGWEGTPGKLRFLYSTSVSNYYYIQSNSTFWQKERWYHVVVIIHPTEGMKMYVDNVKQNSTYPYYSATGNCELNTYIGSYATVPNRYFKGKIDDVIFYNRALTETEVTEIYQK